MHAPKESKTHQNEVTESEASTVKDKSAAVSKTKPAPVNLSLRRSSCEKPVQDSNKSDKAPALSQNRQILRAERRFTSKLSDDKENQDDSIDPNALPKPNFVFGSASSLANKSNTSLDKGAANSTKDALPFKFSFKPTAPTNSKEESKKVTPSSLPFGSAFTSEAKLFANKNLFANPMINKEYPIREPRLKLTYSKSKQQTSSKTKFTIKLGSKKKTTEESKNADLPQ